MLRRLVTLGVVGMGIALLGLGLLSLFAPEFASEGYGIPLGDERSAYLIATGMRDIVLGLVALALLWRHRGAIPLFLLCMLILPIADVAIVLAHGKAWPGVLPHAGGAVGIAMLAALALRDSRSGPASSTPC